MKKAELLLVMFVTQSCLLHKTIKLKLNKITRTECLLKSCNLFKITWSLGCIPTFTMQVYLQFVPEQEQESESDMHVCKFK